MSIQSEIDRLATIKAELKSAINGPAGSVVGDVFADYPAAIAGGKASIAAAITDKGVETAADATFQQLATNIGNIPRGIQGLPQVDDSTFLQILNVSLQSFLQAGDLTFIPILNGIQQSIGPYSIISLFTNDMFVVSFDEESGLIRVESSNTGDAFDIYPFAGEVVYGGSVFSPENVKFFINAT